MSVKESSVGATSLFAPALLPLRAILVARFLHTESASEHLELQAETRHPTELLSVEQCIKVRWRREGQLEGAHLTCCLVERLALQAGWQTTLAY